MRHKCSRCGSKLKPFNKYCPLCGISREEMKYIPRLTRMQCIYGPPEVFGLGSKNDSAEETASDEDFDKMFNLIKSASKKDSKE